MWGKNDSIGVRDAVPGVSWVQKNLQGSNCKGGKDYAKDAKQLAQECRAFDSTRAS